MGMGFQFEQHRLKLWDLSWDFKKTISWEMGLGPPFTTLLQEHARGNASGPAKAFRSA